MPFTTFNPIQDVYIAAAYPNKNFDNRNPNQGQSLFIGTFTNSADIYRTLLQFDIFNTIPANSTIESAILLLAVFRNDNPGVASVNGYRLLDFFDQDEVTFNNAPNSSFPTSFVIGGAQMPIDGAVILDVTGLVRGWLNGIVPNNGIELRGIENADDNILGFRSTRFPDSTFWPQLTVGWTTGTLSFLTQDTLSGAPNASVVIHMAGIEQVTFTINNTTNAELKGAIQVSLDNGATFFDDPATAFTIAAGGETVISYTVAADLVRIHITSAGAGNYTIQAKTRDE